MVEPAMTTAITEINIQQTLESMAAEIRQTLAGKQPLLIGVHSGGVWIATHTAATLFDGTSFLNRSLDNRTHGKIVDHAKFAGCRLIIH